MSIVETPAQVAVETSPTQINLDLYVGHWYEIQRYNSWFESSASTDNTATYTFDKDGVKVGVINRCNPHAWWRQSEVKGVATVDHGNTSKLLIRFSSLGPLGHYWILKVGQPSEWPEVYQWALVGTPDRKYLWILSRRPYMNSDELEEAIACARAQGFDVKKLVHVVHTDLEGTRELMLPNNVLNA